MIPKVNIDIVEYLGKKGFCAKACEDGILVSLSEGDINEIFEEMEKNGIRGVDQKVLTAGRKLSQIISDYLSDVKYVTDGYYVDDKNKTIEVKLVLKDAQWKNYPRGWTKESLKKMWKSLTGDAVHKITACIKKMEGKVDNPAAFCASLAREVGYKGGSKMATSKIDEILVRRFERYKDRFVDALRASLFGRPVSEKIEIIRQGVPGLPRSVFSELRKCSSTQEMIDKVVNYLETEMHIVTATLIMKKFCSKCAASAVEARTENQDKEKVSLASSNSSKSGDVVETKVADLRKRIKNMLQKKSQVEKYDPVTDVYTGVDEGPTPTMAHEDAGKVEKLPVTKAHEDVETKEQEITIAQETKSDVDKKERHLEALEVVEKALELGMIKEENLKDEYAKLLELPDIEFNEIKQVVLSTINPEGLVLVDGKLADVSKLFE